MTDVYPSEQRSSLLGAIFGVVALIVALVVDLAGGNEGLGGTAYIVLLPFFWFIRSVSHAYGLAAAASAVAIMGFIFVVDFSPQDNLTLLVDRCLVLGMFWFCAWSFPNARANARRRLQRKKEDSRAPARSEVTAAEELVQKGRGQRESTQAVFNHLPLPSVIIDFDGTILAANPRACEDFGYPEGTLKGQGIEFLTSKVEADGRETLREILRRKDPTQIQEQELFTARRADGSHFPAAIRVGELEKVEAEKRLFVASFLDLSQSREGEGAEQGARQLTMTRRAGRVSGAIVHKVAGDLARAQVQLDLLKGYTQRQPQVADMTASLENAVGAAGQHLRELLLFGRAAPLSPEPLNINDLIREKEGTIRNMLGEDLELELDLAGRPWTLRVDHGQLDSAVMGLLENAREASRPGGKITLATGKMSLAPDEARQVGGLPSGDYMVLTVEDGGTGISSDIWARAKEPFFTTRSAEGRMGLGLTEISAFAERSGGFLDIYSELDRMTIVRLFLPVAKEEQQGEGTGHSLGPVARQNRLSSIKPGEERILYVDRDQDMRNGVARLLSEAGYTIVSAADGFAAYGILSQQVDFSLLICNDILDGQRSGRQLAELARELYPDLKVIMLFTDAIEHEEMTGIVNVRKPFRRQDLINRVREVIRAAGASSY